MRQICFLISLAVLLAFNDRVLADDILVVVGQSSAVDKISLKQLENIYRRKTQLNPAGEKWHPINLSADTPLRNAFAQKVYQEPPEVMEEYWNIQYFQGIMPPYVVNSTEAMLRVLDVSPGAIGYVLPCQIDKRVRIVLKLTVSEDLAAMCKK